MAMDFKSAGQRVRSLVAAKKPQQLSPSALTPDKLRDNVIAENLEHRPRFNAVANQKPTVEWTNEDGATESYEWDGFRDAVVDVARAGFEWNEPQIQSRDKVRPSRWFNREMVARTIQSKGFQESRPWTRDNADESIFGAQGLADELVDQAPEVAEHLARSQEMQEQEQAIDDAQQMIDELREQAKGQHEDGEEIDPQLIEDMKRAIGDREDAKEILQGLIDAYQQSGAGKAAWQLGQALGQAVKDNVDVMRAANQFPGNEPGSPHNISPGARIALAEKLAQMPNIVKMLEEVGRLVRDMSFKRQARSRNVQVEPVGIKTGQDVTKLLPHELARMQVPALKALWALDWANRSLLEWEMGGKEPIVKGPGIVVYDGSGSMGGRPIEWTHALALGIFTILHREKRDFGCIEFGYSKRELKSWFFPAANAPDPDEVIDMATHFFGGGTDITTGLAEAKRIVESVPAFNEADIILISDGQDQFASDDAAMVSELEKLGVRIHGISIMCPGNRYLEQACEYVVDVTELATVNGATDALAENIT